MLPTYSMTQMLHPAIRRHRPLLAVLALAVLTACSGSAGPSQGDAGGSNEHAEPSSAAPSGIVEIKADMQHALRFKIEPLRTATAPREISGFGRVLDPEPLATAVSERESARASALASTQELHRLQSLEKQNTASMRALQAAEAAAVRDRMLVQSINDRIELTWGRALARRPDLAELVQALVAQDRLIVRVDLPGGEGASIDPRGARLNPLAGPERTQDADYLGAAPTTDPGLQGRGFLFLTGDNRLKLTVGTAVSASLELADEGTRGLFLPDSAVLRYQGKTWVYRQRSPTSFVRVPVSLGTAVPGGWLIVEGLRPNDQVVTQGAQVLLSEELKPETRLAD